MWTPERYQAAFEGVVAELQADLGRAVERGAFADAFSNAIRLVRQASEVVKSSGIVSASLPLIPLGGNNSLQRLEPAVFGGPRRKRSAMAARTDLAARGPPLLLNAAPGRPPVSKRRRSSLGAQDVAQLLPAREAELRAWVATVLEGSETVAEKRFEGLSGLERKAVHTACDILLGERGRQVGALKSLEHVSIGEKPAPRVLILTATVQRDELPQPLAPPRTAASPSAQGAAR